MIRMRLLLIDKFSSLSFEEWADSEIDFQIMHRLTSSIKKKKSIDEGNIQTNAKLVGIVTKAIQGKDGTR